MARKPATDSTALTRLDDQPRTEVALPADLLGKARSFAAKSRSERTLREYAAWWRKFERWCDANGRQALPANTETIGAYMTWLADGQDKGRSLAIVSINVGTAAIKFRHRSAGYAIDTDNPILQAIWSGIRREIAQTRTTRRVKPIMDADLREIMEQLRAEVPREARDAAILALGWAGALRRSELVGLDYGALGAGADKARKGFVVVDDKGIQITLMTSKASQDTAQTVVIPRDYAALICRAVENWITVGAVQKGTPMFRAVKGRGWSANPQSGYLGVCWRDGRWGAQAWVDGKNKSLGLFDTAEEAHKAYCKARGVKPQKPNANAVSDTRMHTATVANIVKQRIKRLVDARNKRRGAKRLSKEEMQQLIDAFSGHSMRVGFVTSAAAKDVPTHKIKEQSRHKSDSMVALYIREQDKWGKSGLKGVGF